MCLALRTMMVPTAQEDAVYKYGPPGEWGHARREWRFLIQAGAGLVADSSPEAEVRGEVWGGVGVGVVGVVGVVKADARGGVGWGRGGYGNLRGEGGWEWGWGWEW